MQLLESLNSGSVDGNLAELKSFSNSSRLRQKSDNYYRTGLLHQMLSMCVSPSGLYTLWQLYNFKYYIVNIPSLRCFTCVSLDGARWNFKDKCLYFLCIYFYFSILFLFVCYCFVLFFEIAAVAYFSSSTLMTIIRVIFLKCQARIPWNSVNNKTI